MIWQVRHTAVKHRCKVTGQVRHKAVKHRCQVTGQVRHKAEKHRCKVIWQVRQGRGAQVSSDWAGKTQGREAQV